MLGGYQILDLRKIDLTITKTQSNITNAYVLSQLLKLRDFIDKDYDFSKPIENQLKPVLIRYRDKKNGEKSEGAMFGELAVVDNYYTFKITGRISGALILTIKVVFEEITNAYGAKEWVIDTAKIQLQDVLEDLEGNLALEGDLDVSGDLDVGGDAEVTGDASVGGDLTVTGSINGEENPSVKPIYWHGIQLYKIDNEVLENLIYGHILKNDNNGINTVANFKAWIEGLANEIQGQVTFACTGVVKINNAYRDMYALYYNNEQYGVTIKATDGVNGFENIQPVDIDELFTYAMDNKNKIN